MISCPVLIVGLLFHIPGGQADQAVRPTQDMLIGGLSVLGSIGKRYTRMSLPERGIVYLPADTFVDFSNITVRNTFMMHWIQSFTSGIWK